MTITAERNGNGSSPVATEKATRKPYGRWMALYAPAGAPFTVEGMTAILQERGLDAVQHQVNSALWGLTSPKRTGKPSGFARLGKGIYIYEPPEGSERATQAPEAKAPKTGPSSPSKLKHIGTDLKGRALLQDSEGDLFIAMPFGSS